ncbi:transmembrane amino acid transporter protein-domain-containing protein [Amylostereum chailletii]|nr:transmembrane amino acid transporter protein-domain-containing protein [Amylostereum chailletii]
MSIGKGRVDDAFVRIPVGPSNSSAPSTSYSAENAPLLRKPSMDRATVQQVHERIPGRSTFNQTLFNAGAMLLGIGILSEPLAFSYAGWIAGAILMGFYGYITCYTAKFLARVVASDPRIRSYADIGQKAFGPRSSLLISTVFCIEMFGVSVILVTLFADSLRVLIPEFSPTTYKVMSLIILIPSVFVPLSLLSYTSLLGIFSTISLIAVIFFDGLSKADAPGSLISPAETSFLFASWDKLGMAFGLFMAGFGAHCGIPALVLDMEDPKRFDEAMDYAFCFATIFYTLIGIAGYLMFGDSVHEEISQNLLGVAGYSPALNKVVLWMLVITPLTKFPLTTRPLNLTFEAMWGLDTYTHSESEESHKAHANSAKLLANQAMKHALITVERTLIALFAVAVSILVPDFSSLMAILGSFSAFLLCVIGPVAAKMAIEGGRNGKDMFFITTAALMAAWGTVIAVSSAWAR